jgi:hypothetical protein
MPTAHPEVVTELLSTIARFRNGLIPVDQLKASIWTASQAIRSIAERDLRDFLQATEGEIDTTQFTSSASDVRTRILAILDGAEARLRSAEVE